jgi:RNA polymerase sigma factor (sigma-70 family)
MMGTVSIRRRTSASSTDRSTRLETLYQAEYLGMVRLAYSLISNNAEAEEIVQDCFVDVYRRFDEIREPRHYLRRAVVNRSHSVLRRRQTSAAHRPEPPESLDGDASNMWDVLNNLPEDHRVAVVLRYYGGYRASEIASIVDRPASTVRSHLRRGLAQLRRELES